jgi:Rieske Fe-S protein
MEKTHKGRRKLIKTLVLVLVSLPLLGKFLIPRTKRKKGIFRVKKTDVPGGGALVFGEKKIAVIKDGKYVYALNLTCTHLGCTVDATPKGFACPCHGSVFNTLGEVIKGPADHPLARVATEEQNDDILIMMTS